MAKEPKQEYVKIQVALTVGNRKSQITDPVEVDEKGNSFPGELNTLVMDFLDAIKSLPNTGTNYTRENLIDSVCACFELQRVAE